MDLESLNPVQRQAVKHVDGPVLVLAGAGTGKTHLITSRIGYLILEKKVPAERIVALTFTDKAAREMEERVDSMLPYGMTDTRITTFHSFGERILGQYAHDIGLPLNLKLLTKSQQLVWLRQHIDQLGLDYYAPTGDPGSYLGSLSSYFSRLADELVDEKRYREYLSALKLAAKDDASKLELTRHNELLESYLLYQQLKREQGLIDYDDQVGLVVQLFETRPNALKAVQSEIDYLMVDEFQDTNRVQNRLLELLAGSTGNLMVVGDDDQSIYRFRGAAISNIMEFGQHFKSPESLVLTENYRSTQEVLDTAYRLIQHNNPDRLEAKQGLSKYLTAQSSGPMPVVLVLPTFSLEADAIASDIKRRIELGQSPDSIAILLRKKNQADSISYALRRHGVDYHFSDSQSLYDQPEIASILHFLQVLTDPTDSKALYHLLASDVVKINLALLMQQSALARRQNHTLEQHLRLASADDLGDESTAIGHFLSQLDIWRQQTKRLSAGELLFQFCDDTGLIKKLVQEANENPAAANQVKNVGRLFAIASEFEQVTTDRSPIAFAQAVADLRSAGEEPEATDPEAVADQVRIMTIHKSKGLEFDVVYIFDLTKGSFPGANRRPAIDLPPELASSHQDPATAHLQEERRLMYVAMTRAKTDLIMTYSPDHGGKLAKKPSPFIAEALGVEPPTLDPSSNQTASIQQELELFRPTPMAHLSDRWSPDSTITLTPHQIDDYLSCPANFHYRHVLMVPEPPVPALMYGNLIHAAIGRFYALERAKTLMLEPLIGMVDSLWRSDGFISEGQEAKRRKQASQTIEQFYNREGDTKRRPRHIERSFEIKLDDIDVVVRGRIDAVYVEGDQIEIRDYKTSAVTDQKKADAKAKSSVQLLIYALAWNQLTGQLPTKLTLDFVDTGLMGSFVPTLADLDKTRQQIAIVAKGIRNGEFSASGNCFYCSHPKTPIGTEASK